jgi:prepilin-type N-terminal cleavage/methylation domain-containing protein
MQRARGFSLIEVVIASALLGIGVAAVVTGYRSAASLEAHQERVSTALHVAEGVVESLLLRYRDDPDIAVSTTSHPSTPLTFDAAGTPVATGGLYAATWRASAGPVAGSRKLDVVVTWQEPGFTGRQSLALTTHRN